MFSLMPRRRERREGRALMPREYTPFDLLHREFGPLFDRFFADWPVPFETPIRAGMEPRRLDFEETDREYLVRAEVPGFDAKEIEVTLTGDVLTMRAEHTEEVKGEEGKPVERRYGRWERAVTLPAGIAPESIEAVCRNGMLEVHLPKAPGAAPRRVEVKT